MLESVIKPEGLGSEKDQKQIMYIRADQIRPNPYQPRRKFSKSSLEELSNSIKEVGVIQPISVRKISSTAYELISGERRLRACKLAGINLIPAIIVEITDNESALLALIENLQREDLGYIDEAEGYKNLVREHGLTQEDLAQKIGKSQSTIANKIRLLKLSPLVRKILVDNELTERHARALLKLHDEQLQLKVLKKVCEKGLNVKKTEELVDKAIDRYVQLKSSTESVPKKLTRTVKDIRIFVNTIKQAIDIMRKAGVNARAAQRDMGEYVEFIVRIPKKENASTAGGKNT